jgi:hypothetical protein
MIWDEADAHSWLEQRYWDNLQSSKEQFLWRPRRNAVTGTLMWLRRAVEAKSGWVEQTGGAELEYTQVRWYEPKDFVVLQLKKG